MIELKQTVKGFDGKLVLDHIDLTIPKGTAYGLLGSNGAGKSTILRLLCGVYRPEGGEVLVDGEPAYDNVGVKQRVFFINDETVQFQSFTLLGLRDYYKQFYPNFSDEVFDRLQGVIQLPTDKKLSTFSKGMKRQAIVIVGISCQPDYLLLDEAFDGLDPTMRILVKRMLVDAMLDRKMTTVISSHNLKEINEVCDSVALLHNGSIIFSRELDDVKSAIHKLQVVFQSEDQLLGTPPAYTKEDLEAQGIEILQLEQQKSIYYIIARGDEETLRRQFAPLNPTVMDIIPLSLEEIFIYELEVLGYGSNAFGTDDESLFH